MWLIFEETSVLTKPACTLFCSARQTCLSFDYDTPHMECYRTMACLASESESHLPQVFTFQF